MLDGKTRLMTLLSIEYSLDQITVEPQMIGIFHVSSNLDSIPHVARHLSYLASLLQLYSAVQYSIVLQ